MCTAVSFLSSDHYFGRNLDLEYCYDEAVTVTPRNYPLKFRCLDTIASHYAMIGTAIVRDHYPLYYDATNEHGLSMAGLNFAGNAVYEGSSRDSVTPFELIPWVLCQCRDVEQAAELLERTNLAPIPFSKELPITDLHWMVSDRKKSIVVEPLKGGLVIRDDPVGVLTNNPPFDYHLHNLKNYLMLSEDDPENMIAPQLVLKPYSRGMGAMGLPGDLSSASRFIKATFTALHSVRPADEHAAVNQFFHILGSVYQQEGCVRAGGGYEKTVYSSCCNTDKGVYYYTTYGNSQINAVYLHREDLQRKDLIRYPFEKKPNIREIN